MPSIVFYVTGHGFGHASRVIEVINALTSQRRDLEVHVRTSAAREDGLQLSQKVWGFPYGIAGVDNTVGFIAFGGGGIPYAYPDGGAWTALTPSIATSGNLYFVRANNITYILEDDSAADNFIEYIHLLCLEVTLL